MTAVKLPLTEDQRRGMQLLKERLAAERARELEVAAWWRTWTGGDR